MIGGILSKEGNSLLQTWLNKAKNIINKITSIELLQ